MEADKEKIVNALLAWYDSEARVLPWRSEPTPYRVWVSEIMLQQTQVATVIPYFERFMANLADVASLAAVDEEQLFKLWEGLGYYSRARNLHRAAEQIMTCFAGQLPASKAELLTLPGIGDYTAGAIASIAFGQREAAVDGNVLRVFARLLADKGDISQSKVKKHFQTLIQEWVPAERPGDFNQSLMELGARICTPKALPACAKCPIGKWCEAHRLGLTASLPVKSAKKARQIQKRTVLLIVAEGEVLLQKRPRQGLLAGLWEYPSLEGWLTEAELSAWLSARGLKPEQIWPICSARHIFTHKEWLMQGYAVLAGKRGTYLEGVWAGAEALDERYAMASAYRAYTEQLPYFLAKSQL